MDSVVSSQGSVGVHESSESKVAYAALEAQIREASRGEVPAMNTDVVHATQTMLTCTINTRAYRAELERIGCREALDVERRALALAYANALVKWSQDELMPLTDAASAVALARKELLAGLNLLAIRGVLDAGTVKVQSTTSYLGMADDVRAVATALLARWYEVGPHIGGDRARVEQALVTADKLMRAVAESEALKEKAQNAAAMRAGAWALALEAYRDLQRGITFLRAREGDADLLVPAIFYHGTGKSPKAAEPDAAEATTPAQPVPSPAAPANGVNGANVAPAPMAPSKSFEQ